MALPVTLNLKAAIFVAVCFIGFNTCSSCEIDNLIHQNERPSLYEYFGGLNPQVDITSGLIAEDPDDFELNGKRMKLLGGSMHYFRIHPKYWRDRLRKYRAAKLNSISVYVPWNLHEPEKGVFDFGDGGRDLSPFLNLTRFLEMAKEEDLFVVFRPGPYICAEWEFGGLPSWLLSEHPMFVRTCFDKYEERVNLFFKEVLSRVKDLQFYTSDGSKGGPIIAVQIENEYGSFGYDDYPRDIAHLHNIKLMLEDGGVESLLFTSDNPKNNKDYGTTDGANFKFDGGSELDTLRALQPNKPLHVTEYWPGWFDHWFSPFHCILTLEGFNEILDLIFSRNSSVNFYMFHGGTNWGFMNGANVLDRLPYYAPDVTSYDYDAPITESGDYTEKYYSTAIKILEYDPISSLVSHPDPPEIVPAIKYGDVQITEQMDYEDILSNVPIEHRGLSENPKSMEQLEHLNNGNGQSYGYIVYRKKVTNLKSGSVLKIRGKVHDLLSVMVNGVMIHDPILSILDVNKFGSWSPTDSTLEIDLSMVPECDESEGGSDYECVLDLMVENLGRSNFGKPHTFDQKKGIWEGPVLLDDKPLIGWEIIPLEFKGDWVSSLGGWKSYAPSDRSDVYGPKLFKGLLHVNPETDLMEMPTKEKTADAVSEMVPRDTYFDFSCGILEHCPWLHGSVFVNNFNVGRYHKAGPQQTLYIPGPLLHEGDNEILIMESWRGNDKAEFTSTPDYGSVTRQC